ncbi:hypothetical protein AALP_AAs41122U000500 [Arabis alpina]|uniref:RING-type E3 ubiquitin transferase n=1 Tax=Arabis alpina TaxID=50452 RepID=A0A087G2U5_ARAAL|nr:hypothetical protein AALP_AAs41122U000500 [Arabis alpina]
MSFRDPNPQTKPGPNSDDPVTFSINGRIMLTAIIIILFVVILMVTLHLYSRWYLFRSRRFNLRRSRRAAAFIFFSDPSSTTSSTVTTRGLETSVIKTLPIFTFTASNANANAENAIECAVCLSEFEENESGRVLPNCKHTFHVDCIDMWFHSHSTCPLCRSPVIPIAGDLKTTVEEVAISISDTDPGLRSDPEAGTSEGSRRKPAAIEIPVRNIGESEENDLSRSQSFRSPMSRVMSFTRILSRERRNPSSSSVGLSPVVSPPVTEFDIELGGGRREETC